MLSLAKVPTVGALCIALALATVPLPALGQDARSASVTTTRLAADFRRMHAAHAHRLQGASDPALDAWGGPFHTVISELGRRLAASHARVSTVLQLMGPPDARRPAPLTARVGSTDCDDVLIYEWRGGHDFLYFCIARGVVARSDWWMAGE